MPRSGHGAKVSRAKAATPSTWVEIAEMKDVKFPELTRNVFDGTTQNLNIDSYTAGVLRRSVFGMELNFMDDDSSHDHINGLLAAMITEPPPIDGYKIVAPVSGVIWVMSGQLVKFNIGMPVDGLQPASVEVRPSGKMTINGIIIG